MKALLSAIENELNERIITCLPVSGGDINKAFCLHTQSSKYFIKVNSNSSFPGMFEAEAAGLELIGDTGAIAVPQVLLQGNVNDDAYLILKWLDTQSAGAADLKLLGTQLAAMHQNTSASFGLYHHNYMGSLRQRNKKHNSWASFFIEERLEPMVKLAVDNGLLSAKEAAGFDELYHHMPNLFDEEQPALIHGDLWGGNYLISTDGKPNLIDPAVSYGHREFDIAMTTLFGGFGNGFYEAYSAAYPLAQGWQQRLPLWNIYPLLIHLNLFGGMYKQQVLANLSRYI
ncbi:fructosamine kinase family protein [Mucilaginibacter sp. UR6-1]|uniref:fructosamine kinase family protein n=1 Tax=Mucilaginibacter sp. UR6-1 TaxID=1435643 RepID=UPI001E5087D3|nr:fructosamine kinase family protein [Mucilaginibacter sp. UR6-1]MCC8407646.1 fructosamine kinase family protein [Mucilaginibacter sp. UR6-1]